MRRSTGNVLDNDLHANGQPGADTPTSFVELERQRCRPVRHLHADTGNGSYSYTLNNAHAAVQGLDDVGQTLTETFNYTMQDADGDTDTATLTITINGANDAPTVTVDHGQSLDANDRSTRPGLPAGSDAASTSEFATGTFTLADPDGLDDLVSVTIDGLARR